MTFRELFEGIINNKIPYLDIIDTVEELASKKSGVTKEFLDQIKSDFSIYLQEYVALILKERESDNELIEEYQELKETDEVGVNFYLIQEYYSDAGLSEWQKDSIIRFCGIIYNSIRQAEYLMNDKVSMRDSMGDIYRKGLPNSFFYEVYSKNVSELEVYSRVKELTDNFDSEKIDLLCEDFDLYFHTERDWWIGNFTDEEIHNKMRQLEKEGKDIPTFGAGYKDQSSHVVSDYFKSKRRLPKKKLTDEQKKDQEQLYQEMKKSMDKSINKSKLMDPHGWEFYSLYRLRNLLVKLKAEHTSSELKPEYQSNFGSATSSRKSMQRNIQPIHWLKGEESLRLLIDELQGAGLIEERKTEDIIQEHFKQSDQTPNPFKWTNTNRLLIYLFNRLSEAGLVDTMDKQFKLITEHFLDKKGQPFKRNSLKQDSYNLKYNSDPKGSNIIDNIISKLSD